MENDEIEQFIIWDCIDLQDKYEFPDYRDYHINNIHRIAQTHFKHRHYVKLLDIIYNRILNPFISFNKKHASPKILWYSTRNSYIFYNIKNGLCDTELIPSGIKDRFSAIKHLMKYNGLTDMFGFISDYMLTNDINYLTNMLMIIETKLKTIKPDYVVLQGDSLPVERAIILACRNLGIITINIQDGIYHSQLGPPFGHASDYAFVWGQYFKDMYVNSDIKTPDKVYVLGYPYKLKRNTNSYKCDDYIIYCLGDNYEIYNKDYLNIKINTLTEMNEICLRHGMSFYYRPHPGDDRGLLQESIPSIRFTPIEETLEQSFTKGDIFIGFSSTTIPEASMRNKITIQLKNYPIPCDNLEELGACTKTVETFADLEKYLTAITGLTNHPFNNYYIDITKNPSKSFLNIISDIEMIRKRSIV